MHGGAFNGVRLLHDHPSLLLYYQVINYVNSSLKFLMGCVFSPLIKSNNTPGIHKVICYISQ